MALVTAVPAWMAVASAAENHSEHRWGERPGERWDLRDAIVNFVASEKRMKQKNHHMAKKKMELKVEVKRLENTERLVENTDVVLDGGKDTAGLTGVVSASNLAIYEDDDDGDENDFFLDLGLDGDDDEVPPRVPRRACVVWTGIVQSRWRSGWRR